MYNNLLPDSMSELNLETVQLGYMDMAMNAGKSLVVAVMRALKFFRMIFWATVYAIRDGIVLAVLTAYYITESAILSVTPYAFRTRKSLREKVVLVTGGAGGVGQELVIRLARIKARVVVWDINKKTLEKLQDRCAKEGHKIYTYAVDIADRHAVYKNADLVKNEVGIVDVLINNAGIVCGNTFLDLPDHMIEKTYNINVISHYWTVKAFLPDMLKKGKGHIVTMGSLTGMLGTYKCTDYSATKHALIGFHESLLTELRTHRHDNINMTLICPYFINTGMFAGCKPRNFPMLEPRDVAKRTIAAIRYDEVFVTMPAWSRFFLPLKNFIPAKLAWFVAHRLIKGPQSMKGLRAFNDVSEKVPNHAAIENIPVTEAVAA